MDEQQPPQSAFNEHVMVFLETYREQVGRSDNWGLEALRNLVLVNAAGIAGTITAYQINAIPRAITPAACYLIGLGAAFGAIALGWLMHRLASNQYQRNAAKYKESRDPAHLFRIDERGLTRISNASVCIGISSLCLFVAGSVYLVDLVRQPAEAAAESNREMHGPPALKSPSLTEDIVRPD